MRALVRRFWFFIGIVAVIAAAFAFPELGLAVRRYRVPNIGIFLTFLITGVTLDFRSVWGHAASGRALVAAVVSSLLLIPLGVHGLAGWVFAGTPDFAVGTTLIAAAPVTVASGTIMTAMALGNVTLSLMICVLCNLAALVTMPVVLSLLLRTGDAISLPVGEILAGLAVIVLVPTVIGVVLRRRIRPWLGAWTKPFSQGVVLLIIFNAVSSSADRVAGVGPVLGLLFVFMILLRLLILGFNFGLARLIRLDPPSTSAFTIHVSQKTLTISYLVWAGFFAAAYPLAMLPGIVYHLTQMVMDTLVARRFRDAAERAARRAGV